MVSIRGINHSRYEIPTAFKQTIHLVVKTGHILDHIMTPPNQLKYFDNIKTIHEERIGNAGELLGRPNRYEDQNSTRLYWDDFTDHLPVEAQLHYYPKWKKPRTHRVQKRPRVES